MTPMLRVVVCVLLSAASSAWADSYMHPPAQVHNEHVFSNPGAWGMTWAFEPVPLDNPVEAHILPTEDFIPLGSPVVVDLVVENHSDHFEVFQTIPFEWRGQFIVVGPDGDIRWCTMMPRSIVLTDAPNLSVAPGKSNTFCKGVVVSDRYFFDRPGTFILQFSPPFLIQPQRLPASTPIALTITEGELSPRDAAAARLQRYQTKELVLRRPMGDETAIYFDPIDRSKGGMLVRLERQVLHAARPDSPQYLGRWERGHVYFGGNSNWPEAAEEIRQLLDVTHEGAP